MAALAVQRVKKEEESRSDSVILDIRPALADMNRAQQVRVQSNILDTEYGRMAEFAEGLNAEAECGFYGGRPEEKFTSSMGEVYLMPLAYGDHYDNARRVVDRLNLEDPGLGEDDTIRTRMINIPGPHLEEGSFTSPRLLFSRIGRLTNRSNMSGRSEVFATEGLNDLMSQIRGDEVVQEFNQRGEKLLTRFAPGEPIVEINLARGLTADKRFDPNTHVREAITYSTLMLACKMAPSYASGVYNPDTQVSDEAFFADVARHISQRFSKYPFEKPLSHKHDLDKRRPFLSKETFANISTIYLPTKLEPGADLDPHEQDHLKDENGLFREIQSRRNPERQKKLYTDNLPAFHGLEFTDGRGWSMVEYVGEQEGTDPLNPGDGLTLHEQQYNFSARCANWHLIHPDREVEERHFMRLDIKDPNSSKTHYRWVMLVRYINRNAESCGHTQANDLVPLKRVPSDMLQYLRTNDPYFGRSLEYPEHESTAGGDTNHQQQTRVGRFFARQKDEWIALKKDCEDVIALWNTPDALVPPAQMHKRIFGDRSLSLKEKQEKWFRFQQLSSISIVYALEELSNMPKTDEDLDRLIAEKMKPVLPFLCDDVHINDSSEAAMKDNQDPTLPYVLESTNGAMMEFQARNFYAGMIGAVATDGRGAATPEFDMPMHDFDVMWPTNYKWSDQKNNFELIKGLVNRTIMRPQDRITRSHFGCSPYAELYGVESPTPYVRFMVPLNFEDQEVKSGSKKAPEFYELPWNAYHWMKEMDARNARYAPIGSVYSRDYRLDSGLIETEPQAFRYKQRREEIGVMKVPPMSDSLAADYNYAEGITELGLVERGSRWGTAFRRKVPGIDPHHSPRGWNWGDAKERANWFEYRSGKFIYGGKRLARAEIRDADWRMSWGPFLHRGSEECAFMFEYNSRFEIVDDAIDDNTIIEISDRFRADEDLKAA